MTEILGLTPVTYPARVKAPEAPRTLPAPIADSVRAGPAVD
jgi:hypothetical protein